MSTGKSNIELGNRIFSIRKRLDLIQKDFADRVGISPNFLSEVERSVSSPSKTLLIAISLRYSINYDWLLTGEGEMFAVPEKTHPEESHSHGECCIAGAGVLNDEMKDALAKTLSILGSGTTYAKALLENIHCFYSAIKTEKNLVKSEKRLREAEQNIEELKEDRSNKTNILAQVLERLSAIEIAERDRLKKTSKTEKSQEEILPPGSSEEEMA